MKAGDIGTYPFLAFSDLTCHLVGTWMGVFWLHCAPDSKKTELGSSNQEAPPSAGKNTGIVLVPCWAWKCAPIAISSGVDISKDLGVFCSDRWVFSEGHKNYCKDWCLINSQSTFLFLTQWITAILWKGYKPDNLERHNSLELSN